MKVNCSVSAASGPPCRFDVCAPEVSSIRLRHISGYWACTGSGASARTNWGCHLASDGAAVLITDASGAEGVSMGLEPRARLIWMRRRAAPRAHPVPTCALLLSRSIHLPFWQSRPGNIVAPATLERRWGAQHSINWYLLPPGFTTYSPWIEIPISANWTRQMCGTFYFWYSEVWSGWTLHDNHGTLSVEMELLPTPPPPAPPGPPPPPAPAPPTILTYCASSGDPHLRSFGGERYDHMGLGAFELLNAPTAQLQLQTFQCPQPRWIRGATANVALAARVGTHTVVIVGDVMTLYNGSAGVPLVSVDSSSEGEQDYSIESTAGEFRVRRSSGRGQHQRWRLESRQFVISSHSYPAPSGIVALGHMMNFQIGLGPQHVSLSGNTGLCTQSCAGVTISGSKVCQSDDCNVLPSQQALFHDVNSSLYAYLLNQCAGTTVDDNPRSPCDPPTNAEACTNSGFSLATATAACAPLQGSSTPRAYESCIYDCCVTADVDFCLGLARETDEQTKDFEAELIEDGRFVNVDEYRPFYELNRTLPAPSAERTACSIVFGTAEESVEAVVLPNGAVPGTLDEVRANLKSVLLMLDASASSRSVELQQALEAAHYDDGQLYACTELTVAPSAIGFEGALSLAASLQRGAMPRLEQLTLSTNELGANGTRALVDAFRAGSADRGPILRNLRNLNLQTNQIDDETVSDLAGALQVGALASLQFVDLANNPVNVTAKTQLAAARSGLIVR